MKKYFKSLFLVGTLLMCFGLVACSSNNDQANNGGEETKELIMVTEAGFAPYEYYDGQEIVGVDVDVANEIAKDYGATLEVKETAFDALINEVKTGKADFAAAGMTITPERQEQVNFSIEYATSRQVVIVPKENAKVTSIDDLTNMSGLNIGVQLATTADLAFDDYAPNSTAVQQKKYLQLVEDLKAGRIDCIVMDSNPAGEVIAANDELMLLDGVLFEDSYGIAVAKENQELLDSINKTLERLKSEGKIDEYTLNHTEK